MKLWRVPVLTTLPGRVKRLSPSTNISDTTPPVRGYIRSLTARRGTLGGCIVVYVRYGKGAGDRYPRALAVGPTLAPVVGIVPTGKSVPVEVTY